MRAVAPWAAITVSVLLAGCSAAATPGVTAAAGAHQAASPSAAPAMVDATAKRARELAGYAKHLGLTEVPDVHPIRFVSPDEQAGYHAACMAEQGYPADADGMYGAAPGQDEAIALALYTCVARYPLADKYEQPYTVAQKRIIYDHFESTLIPCFKSRGFEAPPLPVFETFLAGIGTAQEYNPHAYLDNLTGPQMRELEQACPFLPPAEQLWG
ncbi:hypothetical protein [Propioniciclava sinopodophylli]|uniref:hypothetical protein n=1 Tax=Propioniciclava sinopodophylli TaxID=1837344 RepID=UPI0024908B91|nr:hypothetical protein [Propioniciclava sinopodophylli]